jgi:hypothetical protein
MLPFYCEEILKRIYGLCEFFEKVLRMLCDIFAIIAQAQNEIIEPADIICDSIG